MNFRKAEKKDIDAVMQIISEARARIEKLGIDQWQYGYPSRDVIIDDVKHGRFYLGTEKDEIFSVFAMITDGEPTYDKIYDGKWLTDGRYVAVHRIAVNGKTIRHGIGSETLEYVVSEAVKNGFESVRIDTHEGNIPMRRMLEKNGFTHCGTIYLTGGQKRVAYEKKV